MPIRLGTLFLLLVTVSAGIIACTNGQISTGAAALPQSRHRGSATTPISHVIIVVQENRSFDNFFATFPGANGTTTGLAIPMPSPEAQYCADDDQQVVTKATSIPLTQVTLLGKGFPTTPPSASSPGKSFGMNQDPPYNYPGGYLVDCNSAASRPTASYPCQMNAFDVQHFGPNGSGAGWTCTYLYQYVNPKAIQPYWQMAKQYVLADNAFQSQGSESYTAHQDLIAAGTNIAANESAIDNPTGFPWGCDSAPGSHEPYITTQGKYVSQGPRACYPVSTGYSYDTLRDLLDQSSVSWKYYTIKINGGNAGIWDAFDAIKAVRNGNEWGTNVVWPDTKIFSDITNGTLPAVSWITPNGSNSDHPDETHDYGPSWVTSIVNAVGKSKYWNSSAVVVLWDDFGGFYDHVPPPQYDNQGGMGFRIPILIISPYVKPHVEHTQYETASVVRFVEDNWNLGTLGKLDQRAQGLENAFNFSMTPRPFKPIKADYSKSFFLHQPPSNVPPDTE